MIICPVCFDDKWIIHKGIKKIDGKWVKIYRCNKCNRDFVKDLTKEEINEQR